jgi:hypothetical protein
LEIVDLRERELEPDLGREGGFGQESRSKSLSPTVRHVQAPR